MESEGISVVDPWETYVSPIAIAVPHALTIARPYSWRGQKHASVCNTPMTIDYG